MAWKLVLYEDDDGTLPGEDFLRRLNGSADPEVKALAGRLVRWARHASAEGPLGNSGPYYEKCRDYDIWQLKASRGSKRGRWFFCWDQERDRLVLLSGTVKEARTETPVAAYARAQQQMNQYRQTGRVGEDAL